eukprot:843103-Prorocentrum_minimum.AAC.1
MLRHAMAPSAAEAEGVDRLMKLWGGRGTAHPPPLVVWAEQVRPNARTPKPLVFFTYSRVLRLTGVYT